MNFHVVSIKKIIVGSPLTLASQQGVACFNCSNKIIKNFPRSLRSLGFYKLNSSQGHLISQFAKVIMFWWLQPYSFYDKNC